MPEPPEETLEAMRQHLEALAAECDMQADIVRERQKAVDAGVDFLIKLCRAFHVLHERVQERERKAKP